MVFAFAGDSTTTNAFAMTEPTLPELYRPARETPVRKPSDSVCFLSAAGPHPRGLSAARYARRLLSNDSPRSARLRLLAPNFQLLAPVSPEQSAGASRDLSLKLELHQPREQLRTRDPREGHQLVESVDLA